MFSLRILGIDWLIFRHQHWQIGSRANLLHRRCSSKAVALEKRERRLVFRPDSSAFKDEFYSSSRWLRSLELRRVVMCFSHRRLLLPLAAVRTAIEGTVGPSQTSDFFSIWGGPSSQLFKYS